MLTTACVSKSVDWGRRTSTQCSSASWCTELICHETDHMCFSQLIVGEMHQFQWAEMIVPKILYYFSFLRSHTVTHALYLISAPITTYVFPTSILKSMRESLVATWVHPHPHFPQGRGLLCLYLGTSMLTTSSILDLVSQTCCIKICHAINASNVLLYQQPLCSS